MGSKSQVTGYKYYMPMHIVSGLSRGPTAAGITVRDCMFEFRAGDRVAWSGAIYENGTISVNAPDLFGGDEKEGGVVGSMDVMFGAPDQGVNAYLTAQQGDPQSAHRGLFSLVWKGGQVCSNNPYLKPWAVARRRITGGWYGECWYPGKAPIQLAGDAVGGGAGVPSSFGFNVAKQATAELPYPLVGPPENCTLEMAEFYEWPYTLTGNAFWHWRANESGLVHAKPGVGSDFNAIEQLIERGWIVGETAIMRFASGAILAVVLTSEDVEPYAPDGYEWFKPTDTSHVTELGTVWFWASEFIVGDDNASVPSDSARYCMNPAHIVYQCLTDPNCLGYPTAVIDDASFTAAADQLYAEGLGLNLKWANRETIENFIGIVCDHAGMILLKDRRTGLYKLRLLRDDYNVEDLRVFTPSNSRILTLQRPSPADIVNELQVTYTDYKTFKEATIPVRDAAAVQAMGRIVSKSHSLTGLPTESLAVRCGDRDLAAMTQPLWRIDLAFLRDADDLEPGEPFVLDYPASELFPDGLYVVLRVADEINYGNAANGSITAKCVQDVFSLPLVGSTGSLPDIDDGSPGDPVAATALVFEATYRDLAGTLTASDLAALPVDAGYIAGVAVRPNDDHRGFTLATRIDPAAYADAAEGLFSPSCTLSADIAPGQTVLPVTGWTDMAGLDVGEPLIIGSDENAEWVRVDAIAGDGSTITVGRGCADTVPKPWPSGTRLWAYDAFAAADTTQYIDGETIDAKVLPRTSSARLPLSDAALIQTTMAHRAARPLPPGGLLLNDAPFYDVGGPVIPSPPGGGGGGGGTTTPSTPPPLTPDGTPADTTTGPNGGYVDDAPYPIPPPTTLGTDVLPGGDFGDPADLGQWRNRDGSALGAGWSLVDGKLTHIGGGVAAAYCYGARLSLPISPIPRYTVSVEMDVQCDPSVVTRVGIAWGVSTNGGTPNYVEASEAATYPAEVTVSHEWTRVVERISMLGAGTIPVVTFMPYIEHTGALGGSLATVDNAHLVITEVPTPSTPETPDHIDFDAGLTGWTLWPDPTSASPYAPTMAVSGGELSMTVTSEYFTYRWAICDDPLVGADAIGKYIGALFDAWCNDNSTITDATGTYTFGGAAFGVATKLPGQDYVPFTGSLPQRGDWTARKAWVRQILDETNAPGVTTHVAMLLRCSPGKTVKVRNIQPRVTDGVID